LDFRKYNDNEIISLIQEGNEEALNLMEEKYKLFIAKKISKFNLGYEYDDSYQEGLIVLVRSIQRFKPIYNKSFTRYFEMNLENRFISIVRSRRRYFKFLSEKSPMLVEHEIHEQPKLYFSKQDFDDFVLLLSSFEKAVFEQKFFNELGIEETANLLNCDTKKVYNAIDRIRAKLKMHLA